MGILLRLASQWIAGERAEDGIDRVRKAEQLGILGLLNLLGEHVESKLEVQKTFQEYSRLLDLISENRLKAQISIKPTQFGLNLDPAYCLENYLKIAELCRAHSDNFLWIDMEGSNFAQGTIDLYRQVLSKYEYTGLALQAYLRRSEKDVRDLLPLSPKIRLVKGAYNESPEISFKGKEPIRNNYAKLLDLLFSQIDAKGFIAVATHDSELIDRALELSKLHPASSFEFEMLMGVRDPLKTELVGHGVQVREYVPYGPRWLPYSIRRMREKKSNILLLARSIFS